MDTMIVTLKDVLKKRETDINLILDAQQKQELCSEFGLQEVKTVQASFKCVPISNQKGIALTGQLTASVVHECVVTFAPVPQNIQEKIAVHFTPDGTDDIVEDYEKENFSLLINNDYDVEILEDDQINLYDIIFEYLSLSLASHPRVANAPFKDFTLGTLEADEKIQFDKNIERIAEGKKPLANNPFASLAALKEKL